MHRRGEGPQQGLAGEQHRPNSCSSKRTINKAKEFPAYKCFLGVLAGGALPGTTKQHVWAHPGLPLQPRGVAQASPPPSGPPAPPPATVACILKTNGRWAPPWTIPKKGQQGPGCPPLSDQSRARGDAPDFQQDGS